MLKICLVFVALCFALSGKINDNLLTKFKSVEKLDIVVKLQGINYKQMQHKGVSFNQLDIDTKAEFIVQTLMKHAKQSQEGLINSLKQKNMEFSTLWIMNAVFIKDGSLSLAQELEKRGDVVEIFYNEKYEVAPHNEVPSTTLEREIEQQKIEWNLEFAHVPEVWKKGFTGKGKVIGLVDTGVNYKHPSLVEAYVGNKNGTFNHDYAWYDPSNRLQEPADTQDHGSHCTGTVLGSTKDKKYITGASHDSKWIHCHFVGTFEAIAKCFQFLLAPHDRRGENPDPSKRPHVTSHSYGGGGQGRSLLEDVVLPCIDAGVHVVVAAHNYGSRCGSVTDPGVIPKVLTCGALGEKSHVIAPFSSRGPNNQHYNRTIKPEISAPGVNIVSANGRANSVDYTRKSGTSMSTPLVAGIVALLWSAVPKLNRQIELTNKILYETAYKQTSRDCSSNGTPNNVYGHGTINALKAYNRAIEILGEN